MTVICTKLTARLLYVLGRTFRFPTFASPPLLAGEPRSRALAQGIAALESWTPCLAARCAQVPCNDTWMLTNVSAFSCAMLCDDSVRAHNDYRLAARLRTPIVFDHLNAMMCWSSGSCRRNREISLHWASDFRRAF